MVKTNNKKVEKKESTKDTLKEEKIVKKSNGKFLLIIGIIVFMCIMTWIVKPGLYSNGEFIASESIIRNGIYDLFFTLRNTIYYNSDDIVYLLLVGASYGILSKTKGYSKLVTSLSEVVTRYRFASMCIVTLVLGIFASLTSNILSLVWLMPFIVSVFLEAREDKFTALLAAVGGPLIGLVGLTFGTYTNLQLMTIMGLEYGSAIWLKILVFIVTYGFFNLFACLRMRKNNGKIDDTDADIFKPIEVDESTVKRYYRAKVWPTVLGLVIVSIIGILAFINWSASFNVTAFNGIINSIAKIRIHEVPFLANILGLSAREFGSWTILGLGVVLFLTSIVLGLISRMSFDSLVEESLNGIKKFIKVIFMYIIIQYFFVFMNVDILLYNDRYLNTAAYLWPVTLINAIIGSKFSVIRIFFGGLVGGLFMVNPENLGYTVGGYLYAAYSDHLLGSAFALRAGYAFGQLFVPTALILMLGLTYLDIPYTTWLKRVWKLLIPVLMILLLVSFVLA